MATYFVYRSGDGTSPTTDPGTSGSWPNAYATYGAAVTAATSANDVIKVSDEHYEDLASDTTYTFTANVQTIVVDHQNTANASTQMHDNPTTYYIGHSSANRDVFIQGAYNLYFYGATFRVAGSVADTIEIMTGNSDGAHYEFEKCNIYDGNTGSGGTRIGNSQTSTAVNQYCRFVNCSFYANSSGRAINIGIAEAEFCGCVFTCGTAPSPVFNSSGGGPDVFIRDCDLSQATGTIVGDSGSTCGKNFWFTNCNMATSYTPFATQTQTNLTGNRAWFYNCAGSGVSEPGRHGNMMHYDALGSTVTDFAVYVSDNPTYDGTNKCSWKIETTANATFYMPYISPIVTKFQSTTGSGITPTFEVLRSGSTTAYYNDEVWGEWSYQGTADTTLGIASSDRMTPGGSRAAQDSSSKGTGDWTGEDATNNWFGKLVSASVTPQEKGYLCGRVAVGKASSVVYVDPQIRV